MVDVLGMLHEGEPGSKQLSSPPLWGSARPLTWISTGGAFNAQCLIAAHMSTSLSGMNCSEGGFREVPGGQRLGLCASTARTQVQCLVGELRSRVPCGQKQEKNLYYKIKRGHRMAVDGGLS